MPLYKTFSPSSQTTVKIWKITESFDYLFQDLKLNQESFKRVSGMKSEIHQRGFLSVRVLLKAAGYTDFDLYYNGNGKYIQDGGPNRFQAGLIPFMP